MSISGRGPIFGYFNGSEASRTLIVGHGRAFVTNGRMAVDPILLGELSFQLD
jgi:hypothetical protein